MELRFESISKKDLEEIRGISPEGWGDITPEIEFYIKHEFCFPIKAMMGQRIAGIGASIVFGKSAWLAHIIVHPELRGKGIGYEIVQQLLDDTLCKSVESCLLIATALGQPLYEKAGFRTVSEYRFFKRESPLGPAYSSEKIKPLHQEMYDTVIQMDEAISGEKRGHLISSHLKNALTYVEDGEIKGYYLPSLREGPIYAETEQAGLGLMKIKYANADKAALPAENVAGVTFLKDNGFKETEMKGTRMILGKEVLWQPKKIFSRIGGNYG